MINRLDITDEYSVKCDFILNTITFIDTALNISLRKLWKCNVLWFYLFGQGVPNETKGTINLKGLFSSVLHKNRCCGYSFHCQNGNNICFFWEIWKIIPRLSSNTHLIWGVFLHKWHWWLICFFSSHLRLKKKLYGSHFMAKFSRRAAVSYWWKNGH